MNQEKIGKFIAELRKEKKLTQESLANKLCITDRAISKWENGRGLPDLSLMMPLCEILEISINELLSGEKIKNEDYKEKSEENIINTIDYSSKKIKNKNVIIKITTFILILLTIIGTLFLIDINRMANNKDVIFSYWGIDYYPPIDLNEEKIEEAIINYVVEVGDKETKHHDNEKTFASVKIYKIEEHKNEYIAYTWILSEKYYLENDKIELDSGYSIPHKIKIIKDNDTYKIDEFWTPRDGSLYAKDMKELFPYFVRKKIEKLHKDGTFKKLDLKIQRDIKLYFHK